MDRRKLLGRSKAELVMSRVGHGVGLLCALVLLPLLPLLAVLALGVKLFRVLRGPSEPSGPTASGGGTRPGSGAGNA